MVDEFAGYRKADGSIDWGRKSMDDWNRMMREAEEKTQRLPLTLGDLKAFQIADEVSDRVWDIVSRWNYFAKKTLGDQIARSADSMGANIAEGYGRYFFGEYITFLYYSRGSVFETAYWTDKAFRRNLITREEYQWLRERLDILPLEINKVVKIVRNESKKWMNGKRINN